jgi:DNA-binding CsgD family transcriptional regulator
MVNSADLLDDIYEGILETSPWSTFLAKFAALMRSTSISLLLRAPSFRDEGLFIGHGINSEYYRLFRTVYFRDNPFAAHPRAEPCTIDELIPRKQLVRTDYYRKFLRPGDTEYILGATLRVDNDSTCLWTASRTRAAGNFGQLEKNLMAELSPHLSRAIKLYIGRQLLELEQSVFASALDQLNIGIIVLDQTQRVLCCNKVAVAIAEHNDFLDLEIGTPLVVNGSEQKKLRRMLKDVLNAYLTRNAHYCQALKLNEPSQPGCIDILAKPISLYPIVQDAPTPAISLYIQRPGAFSMPAPEIIRSLFGLTGMEATIVTLISSGLTVDQIAAQLAIKVNTVRVHLRSAFAKTNVSRQSVLVSHVLRSIAMLAT